jgi:uncharacterized protein YndB with AHSA1/START domain
MTVAAAAATRALVVERVIAHPPEKIWRALTQGALLEEWLMKNDFQPVVGARFSFRTEPMPHWDGVVDCEVLAVEPHRHLAYRWNAAGGLATTVTWTLTPVEGGTRLRMEQEGFGPQDDNNYKGAAYGWPRNIDALEKVVAGLVSG